MSKFNVPIAASQTEATTAIITSENSNIAASVAKQTATIIESTHAQCINCGAKIQDEDRKYCHGGCNSER